MGSELATHKPFKAMQKPDHMRLRRFIAVRLANSDPGDLQYGFKVVKNDVVEAAGEKAWHWLIVEEHDTGFLFAVHYATVWNDPELDEGIHFDLFDEDPRYVQFTRVEGEEETITRYKPAAEMDIQI